MSRVLTVIYWFNKMSAQIPIPHTKRKNHLKSVSPRWSWVRRTKLELSHCLIWNSVLCPHLLNNVIVALPMCTHWTMGYNEDQNTGRYWLLFYKGAKNIQQDKAVSSANYIEKTRFLQSYVKIKCREDKYKFRAPPVTSRNHKRTPANGCFDLTSTLWRTSETDKWNNIKPNNSSQQRNQ